MFGLIVSDPTQDAVRRDLLRARLHDFDLPLTAFTDVPAVLSASSASRAAFLRAASAVLLQPGAPLPMEALLTYLDGDALTANVLRKYLFLQLSLLPYLRPGRQITALDGYFLLGDDLLVAPVSVADTVDVLLPPGVWTELTGECREGRLRCMRGYNEMPVLVRENALLPIGVNDRSIHGDDADRVTLHWFQPQQHAACMLADGTRYEAAIHDGHASIATNTAKAFHFIVHQNGEANMIR